MTIARGMGVAILALATGCRSADRADRAAAGHPGHGGSSPASSAPLVASGGHEGHDMDGGKEMTPAGYAPVVLDATRASALGVHTVEIVERDFTRTVRTVGVVALDETRTAHVHSVEG